jgi:glyoxylase-like metal-dependent hydrolase (beta-lactamase superfamily II)
VKFDPIPIHAHNPGPYTGRGNTTWLIRGRVPVLIDAGTGDPRHLDELERALDGERLERVLVTHAHSDHVGGAAVLAQRMPHVRFAKFPWPERDARHPVTWERIADNERVVAGDTELVAIHTPGHSPDHLCFWHEPSRSLFCGDLAASGTTVVIPASSGGDLAAYMASLERALAMRAKRLLPAHGPVVDDPDTLLQHYLAHRREREQQVLAALGAGDTQPDAIVSRLYVRLTPALASMARDSVTAHLLKLEREGRVRRVNEGWSIIEPWNASSTTSTSTGIGTSKS